MRLSALRVSAALVLVPLLGGGVALAAPPATPEISGVAARWAVIAWDDGISRCTLVADAALDPGFTKGPPVYARAYARYTWVGNDDSTWQSDFNYSIQKLSRGATTVHTYASFEPGGYGYYIVDRIRFELTSIPGELLSSMEVPTTNTCASG
jgi:hypothetical protein